MRRYVQSRTVASYPPGVPAASFDGIAQLWFDDIDGFLTYAQSENYRDVILPDERRFTDKTGTQLMFSEEFTIIA